MRCLPGPEVPFLSAAGPGYAEDPVRGVINTPVLRLRPFAALVPLRDYPSGSVPCKEPCRAAAAQGGWQGRPGHRRIQAKGDRQAAPVFFICTHNVAVFIQLYQ